MMDKITQLKKFEFFFIFLFFSFSAQSEDLPFLFYAGKLPFLIKQDILLSPVDQKKLDQDLTSYIQFSGRFFLYENSLIESLLKNKEKIKEKIEELEISAFIQPFVFLESGKVSFGVQLLDGKTMNVLMQEDLQWDQDDFEKLSIKDKSKKLQQIYFSLVNRLPLDFYVTSQTGHFLTLSAGSNQGLFLGDSISIIRQKIKFREAATGYWSHWDTDLIAQGKVIDLNEASATVELTVLPQSDSIRPKSDGVQLEHSKSRKFFSYQNEEIKN